ncbi:8-oxoguanine deaminase [Allokutzneria sp. NRRL B-24872]|uniref:8-oxoguanine deaminase n=1 Tax=Allokutzneria sp. NRRL B-24872 TaxID=1137961 RepID=UPI000A371B1D|nr:8-oxoguanine deaminase [Allokutzneria sp. NRRL B-24872]
MRTVINGAHVATVDGSGTEYASGHVVIEDGVIVAVGDGAAETREGDQVVNGSGCLVTPGLVNTHHHLYQWATRGYAQQATLFEWLVALYPVWSGIDERVVAATTTAGLAWMAKSGCTTAADHHYVFPSGSGDIMAALVNGGKRVGTRLHIVRGSMDCGKSQGGLPPDSIVETTEQALLATEESITTYHDASPGSRLQIAVGPCSPFSASGELMREGAALARRYGVQMHTHLAETTDEEEHCVEQFGCTPLEYADKLGWLGPDVWLAHGIHFSDKEIQRLGATKTGVAHCPSSNARLGAGIARVRDLLDVGCPVGLGVDGAASNEAGGLGDELRQSLYLARLRGGPAAITARESLWLGTMGGAKCLGRSDDIGSIEVGKQGDVAVWRVDGLAHAGITDPVAALVLGSLPPLELLLVGGETVVQLGQLTTVDEELVAADLAAASRVLADRAGVTA